MADPKWRCLECGRTFTNWAGKNPDRNAQTHADVEHGGGRIEAILRRRSE